MKPAPDDRRLQLGRIHQAKKQLGLGEREYRSLLVRVTADPVTGLGGLDSSAHMTPEQRNAVLAELARLGFKAPAATARKRVFAGKPNNVKDVPLLRKTEALLADGKKPWSYAHAMAKQMFHVTRVEWLREDQLHKLVAALQVDANRKEKARA
jgi:phage gp16-like protein